MKRWMSVLVLAMGIVLAGLHVADAAVVRKGTITTQATTHRMKFQLSNGYLAGLTLGDILPADVCDVRFNSNRVGWMEHSIALGNMNPRSRSVTIYGTANNDRGLWSVHTYDGRTAWIIAEMWTLPRGASINCLDDGSKLVEYSDKRKLGFFDEEMTFDKASYTLSLDFNANVLGGLMELGVNPKDVARVVWNSDTVGWKEASCVFTELQYNRRLNLWYAVLEGIPETDAGNIALELLDGSWVWVNIDEWLFDGARINLNYQRGVIEYHMVD